MSSSVTQEDSINLEVIAASNYPSSAYGQGLLALIYGRNFSPREYSNDEEYRKANYDIAQVKSFNPNPTKNLASLNFTSDTEYLTTFEMKNIAGNSVKTFDFHVRKGENVLTLDLSGLINGVYIVKESNNVKLGIYKLIKI